MIPLFIKKILKGVLFIVTDSIATRFMISIDSAGRLLLVSYLQPMPEFSGDAVAHYDPRSTSDSVNNLASMLDDSGLLDTDVVRSDERSDQYPWKTTAEAHGRK